MRKTTMICTALLLFSLTFGHRTLAQEASNTQPPKTQSAVPAPPEHFYRLDFVVEELGADAKPVNSRAYSTTVSTKAYTNASIRTGSRIPTIVKGGPNNVDTEYQYLDVGTNFDMHNVHEIGRQIAFDVTADVSALAESIDPNLHQPVIRQNRWSASVLIPVGKSTAIFASDSNDSKGSTRVLVTATPIE
jgi:hypothetical protein